jgi:hypothetical protein
MAAARLSCLSTGMAECAMASVARTRRRRVIRRRTADRPSPDTEGAIDEAGVDGVKHNAAPARVNKVQGVVGRPVIGCPRTKRRGDEQVVLQVHLVLPAVPITHRRGPGPRSLHGSGRPGDQSVDQDGQYRRNHDHLAHRNPLLTQPTPYPGAMAIVSKSFDEPDELVTQPLVSVQVVVLGEVYVARQVHQPGWSWSEHVQPIAGTATCQHHHQGVALSGQVEIEMEGGARRIVHAGEAFDIPPGHLSRVVGDEPYVTIEFAGVRGWAKPPESGERVVATLLLTDIVSSTDLAVRLGDAAWKEVLAGHGDRVRRELDRFRGLEVTTTGDGFLALFDGAARAVRCGAAIRDRARKSGCRSAPASTRVRSSARLATFAASPSMLLPVSQPSQSPERCLSPLQRSASSKARISSSRTPASTNSRACWAEGGCTASPRPRLTTASSGAAPARPRLHRTFDGLDHDS